VTSGGAPFLPDLRFPVFPQANEMLFALVMLFAPDLAAHGVQWLMTALTASLVWVWGRDAFGAAAGRLAAAVYLGAPIVAYLAGSGYVDAGLTLFATAALYAVRRWRGTGERRWLLLAALFAATAADVKYLGLFFLGVVGLTILLGHLPERGSRERWRAVLLFGAVALAALVPWYGRIYAWTGNPVFPYFFGGGPWAPINFHGFGGSSLGERLVRLARLPWDTVFERGRYGFQPPYSPVFLVSLPLALLAAARDAQQRRLLALSAIYAFLCLSLPPDSRYLVPVTPLLAVSAAGIAARFTDRRLLIAGLCAACLLPGALYALYRLHLQGPPPFTPATREAWLSRRLPLYPAVAFLNRGSSVTWALHAENMHYYARDRFLGDWYGPASFARVLNGLANPEDLHGRLRRLGADHLLIAAGQAPGLPFPEDAAFRRWFEPVYADSAARVYRLR
jgi:4-amino-4-deoxy-L-arabinose transferase-like glycosyltransferase